MSAPRGTASSRLLSMKFMKRAAAATPSPAASPLELRPNKRARLMGGASTPGTPSSDLERVRAFEVEEDRKRSLKIEQLGAEAGETRWVLSVADANRHSQEEGLIVVETGFADLDSVVGTVDTEEGAAISKSKFVAGRMSFGKKPEAKEDDSSDDSDDSDDSEDSEDLDPISALIGEGKKHAEKQAKQASKLKKEAESEEERRRVASQRREQVDLRRVTSISGSAPSPNGKGTRGEKSFKRRG